MALAISVTGYTDASPCPRVDITVTGATGAVTVTRWAADVSSPVRGGVGIDAPGGIAALTDYEAPIGTQVLYSVTDAVTGTSAPYVTLAVAVPYISDPLSPGLSCPVTDLSADAMSQVIYERDGGPVATAGGVLPIAVVGTRRGASSVPMAAVCLTVAARDALLAVLRQADPVCVRLPGGDAWSWLPALSYISAQRVTVQRLGSGSVASVVRWDGDLVVPPAASVVVPVRTWGNVAEETSTWADVAAMYPTWLDVLRG